MAEWNRSFPLDRSPARIMSSHHNPAAADVFGEWTPELLEVTPPASTKPVLLRYPAYGEWHNLAVAHQRVNSEGKSVPPELVVDTLATCISDDKGKRRLSPSQAKGLLDANPRAVMWLYRKCWETVLRNDDDTIQELEKNSAAGQD